MAFAVGFADGNVAGEAEAKAVAEKWCERKIVVARLAGVIGR